MTSTIPRRVLSVLLAAATLAVAPPALAAPSDSMASLDPCGALFIKNSLSGGWANHLGCGYRDVAIAPDHRMVAVVDGNGAIWAKETLWGVWQRQSGDGESKAVALGPNSMIASISTAGALRIKAPGDTWREHIGSGGTTDVAISPDGGTFAIVNQQGEIWAKQSLWGAWQQHTGRGQSQAVALGPDGMMASVSPAGALHIKSTRWGAWLQHESATRDVSISRDGSTIAILSRDGAIWAKQGLWGTWQQHTGNGQTVRMAVGPEIRNPPPVVTHGTREILLSGASNWTGQVLRDGFVPDGARITGLRALPPESGLLSMLELEHVGSSRVRLPPVGETTDAFNGQAPFGDWRLTNWTFYEFTGATITIQYDWRK